ncbi:MAG TPA: ATP-binding cassette domain-containing protein, partial [Burkholderiales bacterium]|nr:ATP-binding cassette domain-containing protein [Burkholderiales bacterium]
TPRFHLMNSTGRLSRDIERGTASIGFLLSVGLFTIIPTLVEIIAVMAILVYQYNDWFTAIIAGTFVLYTVFTVEFTQRREIYQRALNKLDSNANSHLVDSLINYETVKSYANEELEVRRFGGIMADWVQTGSRNQRALSILHIGQSSIIAVGVAAVMVLAGREVLRGTMTVGDLVLVNAYVIQICLPLNTLGFVFRQVRDAIVNVESLFGLLRQQPELEDAPNARPLVVSQAQVCFNHVEFGYEPGQQILWDIDFVIPPGRTVAVVGGSGSGKSTLARLLMRLYEVRAGSIEVDGRDIRLITQDSLRSAIGIVAQDTSLFNDTIAYNIGYGRPEAGMDEIVQAAKAAHIHDLICGLPKKYQTVVGERGLKLSGGEKQRIAIARAVLKNPPIMVFDEATSALDAFAERAIQAELDRIARNRTTLVIAHRMSTVVGADTILVLEQGRIVERGTHEQLLARAGTYAEMWSLQQKQRELQQAQDRLAMQPVNLAHVVAAVIDALRPDIDSRTISLFTMIDSQSAQVTGDPAKLQQMVWDLCSNAIRTAAPGGRVEVLVQRVGPWVQLKIGEAGGRAALSPQESEQSLDLLELRNLAQQFGGRLTLEPTASGTVYTVDLPPRALSVAERPARSMSARLDFPAGAADLRDARIALVEDQDDARQLLASLLVTRGAVVQDNSTGMQAVDWFNSHPHEQWPDLLICDIGLPDMDGYSVISRIRSIEAGQGIALVDRMPALALTGFAHPQDRTRALLAGFQMHLGKPVDPIELLAVVAAMLGPHTGRRRDNAMPTGIAQHESKR